MAAVIAPHLERLPSRESAMWVRLLPDTAIESRNEQREALFADAVEHTPRERQLLVGGETKQLLSVEARQLRRLVDLRVGRVPEVREPLVYMSH